MSTGGQKEELSINLLSENCVDPHAWRALRNQSTKMPVGHVNMEATGDLQEISLQGIEVRKLKSADVAPSFKRLACDLAGGWLIWGSSFLVLVYYE